MNPGALRILAVASISPFGRFSEAWESLLPSCRVELAAGPRGSTAVTWMIKILCRAQPCTFRFMRGVRCSVLEMVMRDKVMVKWTELQWRLPCGAHSDSQCERICALSGCEPRRQPVSSRPVLTRI